MVVLAALLGLLAPPAAQASSIGGLPRLPDWREASNRLDKDIDLVRYRKQGQEVTVVRIGPNADVLPRQILSRERIAGQGTRTERTSSMCARVGCIVGVNGAFFDRDRGVPVGAVVSDGELLRSTRTRRAHLGVEGLVMAPTTPPSLRLIMWTPETPTVLQGPFGSNGPGEEMIALDGANLPRSKQGIVAYTRRMAGSTPVSGGTELVLRRGTGGIELGSRTPYTVVGIRPGGGWIPHDGVILSALGQGAEALKTVWNRIQAGELTDVVALELDDAPFNLMSSKPEVLRNGRDVSGSGSLASRRHPRTIVGMRDDGSLVLVTIDGRQRSRQGMTLGEAARFLKRLGVVDAYNLDGGGSSTLTVRGRVLNNPPGAERPVATALVFVKG